MCMRIDFTIHIWKFHYLPGMGYAESQYSLPRWQDITVSRQGLYDDTYKLIPTAGWMFVPLVVYHGGGADAMFEPLDEHLVEYEWALAQYLGEELNENVLI